MLRAGPFSDERIQLIINNRFLPFYHDLNPRGFVADAKARTFVTKVKPVLGGRQVPTPPVLFCRADGSLLAEVSNYADADTMLASIRNVVQAHKPSQAPSKQERQEPILQAQIEFLLGNTKKAEQLFAQIPDQQATGLAQAKLARWQGAFDWATQELNTISAGPARSLESAWLAWSQKQFLQAAKALGTVDAYKAELASEARYLHGLISYGLGKRQQAQKTWADLVKADKEDRWIYRADWAYVQTGGGRSLLGRIGYMGSTQPDLAIMGIQKRRR